jgi:plasmid stabilization system protein ParE
MKYTVVLSPEAVREIRHSFHWWAAHRSQQQAIRWHKACIRALRSLQSNPQRWPLSREAPAFPFPIRDRHFGIGRRPTHRIVFRVVVNEVHVLLLRHVAQRDITLDDLDANDIVD